MRQLEWPPQQAAPAAAVAPGWRQRIACRPIKPITGLVVCSLVTFAGRILRRQVSRRCRRAPLSEIGIGVRTAQRAPANGSRESCRRQRAGVSRRRVTSNNHKEQQTAIGTGTGVGIGTGIGARMQLCVAGAAQAAVYIDRAPTSAKVN